MNFNKLIEFTGDVREIRATGGGATSDIWLQIKADILGTEICAMSGKEIGASGTAALAGVACGAYKDLSDTVEKMNYISKRFTPISDNTEAYKQKYNTYKNLYNAIKDAEKRG